MMRKLILLGALALGACAAPVSKTVREMCGADLHMLRVGMAEELMVSCSYAPHRPYLARETVGPNGVRRFFHQDYTTIMTENGVVVAWTGRALP